MAASDYASTSGNGTVPDTYSLPHIDELVDGLSGKEWFSVLDSQAVYRSTEVAPKNRSETMFSDGQGYCSGVGLHLDSMAPIYSNIL